MLNVLFEDHHLIAVNKPAPLLTQAPRDVPSLETLVKEYIKVKYSKPAGVYLGVPHRLDRPVSGVIVFARNTKAAQRMQAQFEARTVVKTYWALVEGLFTRGASEGEVWVDWIRKVPDTARAETTEPNAPESKRAALHCRVLQSQSNATLLELTPSTGRMHQLRVQCAARGHPVLGDTLYGSKVSFGPVADSERERVIALHARKLEFTHPFRDERITLEAPLPQYWDFTPTANPDGSGE